MFYTYYVPPDPNSAVGDTQLVEAVNDGLQVFDKTTGASELGPIPFDAWWASSSGVCGGSAYRTDPVVLYDKLASRWLISHLASQYETFVPSSECVAVSTTSDASGSYNLYEFDFENKYDYPKWGTWTDAYYASYNVFDAESHYIGAEICAYDRTRMLSGEKSLGAICISQPLPMPDFTLLPADIDGSTPPPSGEPGLFVDLSSSSSLNLYKFQVNFAIGTGTPSGVTIPVAGFSEACGSCIPQMGIPQQLMTVGDRLMHRLAYRNFGDHESLVVNHSVNVDSGVGIRWYEIRDPNGSPFPYQQGTFAPDSHYRWMGSIAMDRLGNIALGYSMSGADMYPSIQLTGRYWYDRRNTLRSETSLFSGLGYQYSSAKWGDYTSMAIDPVDDCTFWYTNEYLVDSYSTDWSTRIVSFRFPGCEWHLIDVTSKAGQTIVGPPASWQATEGPYNVEHLAGVDSSGNLQVFSWSPAYDWQAVNVSGRFGLTLSGSVTAWQLSSGSSTVEYVAGVSSTGDLLLFSWSFGGDWSLLDVSNHTGVGQPIKAPLASWVSGKMSVVAGVNPTNGHVLVFWQMPGSKWQFVDASAEAAGQEISGSLRGWDASLPTGSYDRSGLPISQPVDLMTGVDFGADLILFHSLPAAPTWKWQVENEFFKTGQKVSGPFAEWTIFKHIPPAKPGLPATSETITYLAGPGANGDLLVFSGVPLSTWSNLDVSTSTGVKLVGLPAVWYADSKWKLAGIDSTGNMIILSTVDPSSTAWTSEDLSTGLDQQFTTSPASWLTPNGPNTVQHLAAVNRAGHLIVLFAQVPTSPGP